MSELILAEHHDQVYSVWQERGANALSVAHVDFHCDMRGLLIDRKAGEAFFTSEREASFVDRGNYLGHAIMNGMVSDLRWVHAPHGGRGYDFGPVVAYESDRLAPWHRRKHKRAGHQAMPLRFTECLLDKWTGLRPGEHLDLDWDALASVEFDQTSKERLIEQFLARDLGETPPTAFLVYSPGYSDPDRTLFEDFAKQLAAKFKATITRLPQTELVTEGERFSALRAIARNTLPPQVRQTKRAITKWLRQRETAADLDFYAT